jgi:hypothetical protein
VTDRVAVLLASARRGLSPTLGDATRVRLAVNTALHASSSALRGDETPASKLGSTPVHWARVGAALVLAGATGAGGYALGFRAGRAQTAADSLAPAVVRPAGTVAERIDSPPWPVSSPDPAVPRAPLRHAGTGAPRASAAPVAAPNAPTESPLEVETRLLARVDRALRVDNARLALGLLGELEREVPSGQLEEERQAARVIAHCKLGTGLAPKLAAEFIARYAASAYRDRIRDACGLATNE